MTDRPILFSGAMVRALLDGRKTQTRRVVKLPSNATFENCAVRTWDVEAEKFRQIAPEPPDIAPYLLGKRTEGQYLLCNRTDDVGVHRATCPYGEPGDRLWVRETWTWAEIYQLDDAEAVAVCYAADDMVSRPIVVDDDATVDRARRAIERYEATETKWHPSIHMPRWASRLTLEITGVRVERLQAITSADARAEGMVGSERESETDAYHNLWDVLNGPRGFGWDVNPWVWVIEFRATPSDRGTRP